MGREMPIKPRRSTRLSSGGRRRSARLAAATVRAPGQLKQQMKPAVMLKKHWSRTWSNEKQARSAGGSDIHGTESTERSDMHGTESTESSGSGTHVWSNAELEVFAKEAQILAPKYGGWTDEFYEAIAEAVNQACGKLKKKYVPLDLEKVKSKRKKCKQNLEKNKKKGEWILVTIGQLEPNFGSAIVGSSSGAVVGSFTDDEGIRTALLELIKCSDSEDTEMKMFAELLNDPMHLDVFWAHGRYGLNVNQKRSYLNDASKFHKLFLPKSSVKQEDRICFIQSKRHALKVMIDKRVESLPFSNHDLFVSSCLLEDKVIRDVIEAYCGDYKRMRNFLLTNIKDVKSKVLGVSSSCQLSTSE